MSAHSQEEVQNLFDTSLKLCTDKFKAGELSSAELLGKYLYQMWPHEEQVLQLYGLICHAQKKHEQAIEIFKQALAINPKNPENHNNISLCYSNLGCYETAVQHLETALQFDNAAYLYSNLGLQYRHQNKIHQAIAAFRKSIELNSVASSWGMLGGCYGELQDLKEAEYCFKKSIEIDPKFAAGHVDLASIYQLQGEWDQAWPEYEWRFEVYEQTKFWLQIYDPQKSWKGQDLHNKTIVLYNEQGVGDGIHFYRYVSAVKSLGAKVIIHCSEVVQPLFVEADEIFTAPPSLIPVKKELKIPEHDYHASLLSLPYLLQIPIPTTPYMHNERRLSMDDYADYFKIGIVWAGNPQHPNDAARSCYLKQFQTIHDIPGVKLFSLQLDKRQRAYHLKPTPVDLTEGAESMKIVDLAQDLKTFEDTAAAIQSLDLIITVDTAVLHLAGALNHPTWAILPWNPDWRWKLTGNTTEWYPSVTLFRQTEKNSWEPVFNRMTRQLQEKLHGFSAK